MDRIQLLRQWLAASVGTDKFALAPASSDASFRRYFRISLPDGGSRIAMDAPPDKEDCRPFVRIAALFGEAGVVVPRVHAQDLEQGFLLLSDLGNRTYLDELNEASADGLYKEAIRALVKIQAASRPEVLPPYDRALLTRELKLFPEWYIERQLGAPLIPDDDESLRLAFESILANNLAQPRVFVHSDYHSRNLMVCDPGPGVLDFQDAVEGPITYDLVSLLRDAYIAWDEERVIDWAIFYWDQARRAGLPVHADFGEFYRDFEWMGVQRQIKVVGIFARLACRDGKRGYLDDQPRVLGYLRRASERYRELAPLAKLVDRLQDGAAA